MTSSPAVLLSAYQCGPGMGSVSQIGWEWYSRLASRIPVILVTHVRNRAALDLAGAPLPGSAVLYVDTEWFAGPLYRLASRLFPNSQHSVFLISSLDYYLYDFAAVRAIRREPRNANIVHAVTPVSPMAATRLDRVGLPLVLGPWNGGLQTPAAFPEFTSADSAWLYPLRELGRFVDCFVRSTRRAALILTATAATDAALPRPTRARVARMLENGVDLELFRPSPWPDAPSASNPLRILFTGRLIPVKAVPLLLRALQMLKGEIPFRLRIVGDGPCAQAWRREAEAGLGNAVEFLGSQPLSRVAEELRQAHVFCLPSVRESGGAVLLEAMAAARPVIAVAHGGPAEIVDDTIGLAIAPRGPDYVRDALAAAMRDIVERPDEWRTRGSRGRARAEQRYGWDAKIESALSLYRKILSGVSASEPDHG